MLDPKEDYAMLLRSRCAYGLAALVALTAPAALLAQFSPSKTPIVLPPLERYAGSELEPVAIFGDNSDFDVDGGLAFGQSFYHDLAVAGGYMFVAAGRTLEIHALSPLPVLANFPVARVTARQVLPFWSNSDGGGSFFLKNIRAANDNLVAVGMDGQGFSVWKTTNKSAPSVAYQDKGVKAQQLHIVFKNGAYWAFVADNGSGGGLMRYNISSAASLSSCLDDSPSSTPCNGVFQGEVGTHTAITALSGAGDYVAVVPPGLSSAIEILSVASPLSPTTKVTGTMASFPETVTDIALWQASGKLYLAALVVVSSSSTSKVKIYDVTCATTPGSCTLPGPLATLTASDPTGGTQSTLSASTTGSRRFIYVGNSRRGGCAAKREYLFDVTNPSAAFDISPSVHAAGYWGWYYMDCATGFNNIKPWRGYFFGDTFYRAAHSGLDAHRFAGASPPLSSFTCTPTTPFVGQNVACTDTSSGNPDQWSWTFQDAVPGTSTLRDPTVAFTSVGSKQVTLIATNAAGPSPNTAVATLNVVNPAPSVASVVPDVTNALVCSKVTFSATGATGQTPLTFAWEVKDTALSVVATGTGNPFAWDIPSAQPPSAYTATVSVNNAVGPPALATSVPVTVAALPPLAFNGAPTNNPPLGATVQFHIDAVGATEWNWSFGDGTSTGWISNPVTGPNPQHAYSLSGTYNVTLQIRNCAEGPITSAALSVSVTVEPLGITNFKAACPLGFCFFDTGTVVNFTVAVIGTPLAFDYDWDGDSTYEETSATAITKHTYCGAGSYEPVLRVRRGLDQDILADTNTSDLQVTLVDTCSAPAAPTGMVVSPEGETLVLGWADKANNETGYRVLRSTDGIDFVPIASLPANANGYVDTSVQRDVMYTYRAQAFALTGAATSNSASGQVSNDIFGDDFEAGLSSGWALFPPESTLLTPAGDDR